MGEAEALLGLPASTLRHWESVFSLLGPKKDSFGRRLYSEAEIRVLFRIKYLSQRRGLGLRDTEAAILDELSSAPAEVRAILQEVRGDLVGLWLANREALRRLAPKTRRPRAMPDNV
jgi:DNA-binding transcriptional MerR regulator